MHISEGSVDAIATGFRPVIDGELPGIKKSRTLSPEERKARVEMMASRVECGLTPFGESLPDGQGWEDGADENAKILIEPGDCYLGRFELVNKRKRSEE